MVTLFFLRAFYKGFGTNLLCLVNGPVYVTSFETIRLLTRHLGCNPDSPKVALVAGGMAATIEEATGTPVDNIVKRRQVLPMVFLRSSVTCDYHKFPIVKYKFLTFFEDFLGHIFSAYDYPPKDSSLKKDEFSCYWKVSFFGKKCAFSQNV